MTNTTFSSYDYDDIMNAFIVFLQAQDEFKDYNFDGAGIRQILRLLSYNTQNQAFQNNFVKNEITFGDIQLRPNLTAFVAALGYVPTGKSAAKVKATITVTPKDLLTAPDNLVMPKDSRFFANKDGIALNFSPDKDYNVDLIDGAYTFVDVTVLQGIWNSNSFLVQTENGQEAYAVPNLDIDPNTLTISVKENEASTSYEVYSRFGTAYDLGSTESIYFLKQNRDSFYEVEFGDGLLAKKLSYGNIVFAEYMTTQGENGNGVAELIPASGIGGFFDVKIEIPVGERTYGGAEPETMESIKTLSPLNFAADGSAVVDGDYVALTKKLFTEAKDVIAWGGELNTPPRFGYTFLAVLPKSSEKLTQLQKADLFTILTKHNIGSITPIITDPDFTYLNVKSTVKFNSKETLLSDSTLQAKVIDFCRLYSVNSLEKFDSEFDFSKFSGFINNIDRAIKGNNTIISYEKHIVPYLNQNASYKINFGHAIKKGSVSLTGFKVSDANGDGYVYSITDKEGLLSLNKSKSGVTTVFQDHIGTVDYNTGSIHVVNFRPSSFLEDRVTVTVESGVFDTSIKAIKGNILKINNVAVAMERVTNV